MFIYQKIVKRFFDLMVSIILLIFLTPLLIILSILIRIKLGKPCIFKQERPGHLGKTFTLYKFRTMKNTFDETGKLYPDAERLTSFGNLLRKLSLDELPELINVIKGDMSLVGPRPLLIEYLDHYTPNQARRHLVKPGITGWAQVCGRNGLSWDEKFKCDVWYVDNLNFFQDLKIIFMTIQVIFKRKGIHADGHVTMPKFGNNDH